MAAALIHRAIGDNLTCVFVDNGLLREGEAEQVEAVFGGKFGYDLRCDASEEFWKSWTASPIQKLNVKSSGEFSSRSLNRQKRLLVPNFWLRAPCIQMSSRV